MIFLPSASYSHPSPIKALAHNVRLNRAARRIPLRRLPARLADSILPQYVLIGTTRRQSAEFDE